MKTSNKLLLIFFLSALGIFGAVHLALYAKYSTGDISVEHADELQTIDTKGSAPAFLSLKGNLNVRIIASDTFSVEWTKQDGEKISKRLSGDSLIISADMNVMRDPHNQWQQFDDFPWLTVHCGPLKKMQLSGVLALMKGGPSYGKLALAMWLTDTQLLMGEPDDQGPDVQKIGLGKETGHPREFYDSIDIHSVNSNLIMNDNTVIHDLHMQLDDRSELHENNAEIDRPEIRYGDHSRITLSGANLRKLTAPAPPH
jgi:hypothetical protein